MVAEPLPPRDVSQVIGRMSDRDWTSLTLQLGRYALQKSRRFYWRTGRAGDLPDGEGTESLVSKALVLWLTGRRRWNPSEYDDLQSFLQGVIDSLLSHAASGYDNRGVPSDRGPVLVVGATPEGDLLRKERALEAEQTLSEIVRESQHDVVVLAIIDAMRDGAATRREIVHATGRTAADIDNGLKRLRRLSASVTASKKERIS
jgi:hypothetical protein